MSADRMFDRPYQGVLISNLSFNRGSRHISKFKCAAVWNQLTCDAVIELETKFNESGLPLHVLLAQVVK